MSYDPVEVSTYDLNKSGRRNVRPKILLLCVNDLVYSGFQLLHRVILNSVHRDRVLLQADLAQENLLVALSD